MKFLSFNSFFTNLEKQNIYAFKRIYLHRISYSKVLAFAYNAKSFVIAILVFLSFSFSSPFLGGLAKISILNFFSNFCFKLIWQGLELLMIMLLDLLVTWSCYITGQTKIIFSPLLQYLRLLGTVMTYLEVIVIWPCNHVVLLVNVTN